MKAVKFILEMVAFTGCMAFIIYGIPVILKHLN